MSTSPVGHFEQHIRDAIVLNRQRRAGYAQQAGWLARLLSMLLVLSERLCLPLARRFDRRAAPFNARGIPVVEADFIDMALAGDASTPPQYRQVAPASAHHEVKRQVRQFKRHAKAALRDDDFGRVCALAADTLNTLQALEREHQSHFAMSIHLLESIGLAALHAPAHVSRSGGDALPLCRSLVGIQVTLADGGLLMDKLAQRCQARGAGILVNDVPPIPFLSEYRDAQQP